MADYYDGDESYPFRSSYGRDNDNYENNQRGSGLDVFVKKVAEVKRILPSLYNIKVVRNLLSLNLFILIFSSSIFIHQTEMYVYTVY